MDGRFEFDVLFCIDFLGLVCMVSTFYFLRWTSFLLCFSCEFLDFWLWEHFWTISPWYVPK